MAGYSSRNLGQGGISDIRQVPIPGGPLVACRICDAVFTSSQALINHIGSHVADDGVSIAGTVSRRHHQRNATSRFPSFPASPQRLGQFLFTNRFLGQNSMNSDAELIWPHQVSPFARNVYRDAPVYQPPHAGHFNWKAAEEAAGDCTKPYINQLEKCLPKLADLSEEDDKRQLYFSKIDLTLKL